MELEILADFRIDILYERIVIEELLGQLVKFLEGLGTRAVVRADVVLVHINIASPGLGGEMPPSSRQPRSPMVVILKNESTLPFGEFGLERNGENFRNLQLAGSFESKSADRLEGTIVRHIDGGIVFHGKTNLGRDTRIHADGEAQLEGQAHAAGVEGLDLCHVRKTQGRQGQLEGKVHSLAHKRFGLEKPAVSMHKIAHPEKKGKGHFVVGAIDVHGLFDLGDRLDQIELTLRLLLEHLFILNGSRVGCLQRRQLVLKIAKPEKNPILSFIGGLELSLHGLVFNNSQGSRKPLVFQVIGMP